jgi:hemolysin activation/secretion protein
VSLVGPGFVRAQTVPDAGSVRQQIEQQRRHEAPPKAGPQLAAPPALQSLGGATVTVRSFSFVGNTLLTSDQLAPAVTGFLDHPIDFTELQNAAIAVANVYRKAGWVVRAYLPQQDITSGRVTIQVVEATFGKALVEGEGNRISASRLKSIVDASQVPGKPVNAAALDRALLLIGDLPGVSATGRLAEGQDQGQTDLVLAATDGPIVVGDVTVDNAGARYTGAARVIVDASLNSLLGLGDRVDGLVLHTQGSDYQRLAVSMPIGNRGWRVGVNGSHLSYNILTAQFSALDAHGTSTTVGADANYPLIRSRLRNLYLAIAVDDKRFNNESAGSTTTRYSIQDASVGLYGNLFDTFGGGGANSASLTLFQGRVNLAGSPNEAADALTTDTAGSYQKLSLLASRTQFVTQRISLYGSVSGQASSKNLDSAEKFYLGGSGGVRAYPADEGGGSEGVLLNLEARGRLPANFTVTGFFDWGSIHVNKRNDIVGAAVPNTDDLKGAGVSLGWVARFGLSLKATVARRIGSNPNPTSNGDDQDGSLIENRVWLQATMPF